MSQNVEVIGKCHQLLDDDGMVVSEWAYNLNFIAIT
jgi:hypothetical protein